jgi:hypothetical protein
MQTVRSTYVRARLLRLPPLLLPLAHGVGRTLQTERSLLTWRQSIARHDCSLQRRGTTTTDPAGQNTVLEPRFNTTRVTIIRTCKILNKVILHVEDARMYVCVNFYTPIRNYVA